MSYQKPASIIFVTKYVTFMLDFRVIYVTHVTYVIIYVTGVTYMICYKYDPTRVTEGSLPKIARYSLNYPHLNVFTDSKRSKLYKLFHSLSHMFNLGETSASQLFP